MTSLARVSNGSPSPLSVSTFLQKREGILSRMHNIHTLRIACKQGAILSLLVENQGRINLHTTLHDFKVPIFSLIISKYDTLDRWLLQERFVTIPTFNFQGIISSVKFNHNVINGTWKITGYPLQALNFKKSYLRWNFNNLNSSDQKQKSQAGPVIFQGEFTLSDKEKPLDSWIDTRGWRKV